MQIYLQFEDKRSDFTVLELARLMCDVQHITIFILALAEDDLSSEYDLFNPRDQKYERMVVADSKFEEFQPIITSILYLKSIRLESPLQLLAGFFHRIQIRSRLKSIMEVVFKVIIMGDLRREKMSVEIAMDWQDVIRAAIKNHERLLKTAERFEDENQRNLFIRNFSTAIGPFVDGRYPRIEKIEIIEPDKNKLEPGSE